MAESADGGARVAPNYASPVDYDRYGHYGQGRGFDAGQSFNRPRYQFQGRITADGSERVPRRAGPLPPVHRLGLPMGAAHRDRPEAQGPRGRRVAVLRRRRAGRARVGVPRAARRRTRSTASPCWREAYEATEPGYGGHVSVPALWDRQTGRLVSNNFPDITIDLDTQFGAWAGSPDLYPAAPARGIDALNERVYETVNNGTYRVAGRHHPSRSTSELAAPADRHPGRRWRSGCPASGTCSAPAVTEADVRLWPTLARFDLGYNPLGKISERRLVDFPALWGYARDLYQRPAFRETTDFSAFARFGSGPAPSFYNDAPWRIQRRAVCGRLGRAARPGSGSADPRPPFPDPRSPIPDPRSPTRRPGALAGPLRGAERAH